MSAIKNRSSYLAVCAEATAGTYVQPTASTDFLALQDGFALAPNFEILENAEIRASIGVAQPIQGLEKPTASFDHYLRHSGVEGQAPNFRLLLKSVLGAETVNSTQRTTTVGSSVSSVILGAGGSDFARGFAVLVKNTTYEVRPVHSVSSDTLTMGFDLLSAPATGINVGKCVNYSPANTGHPTLSLTLFRGNGGAVEAVAGCRISQASLKIASGQLINASYSFQGTKYFYNPMIVTATNCYLDFTDDDGTFVATVTAGIYRDPHELAAAITSAMNAISAGETHTVSYLDASGKFKIISTGTVLSLLFKTGAHGSDLYDDHIGSLLGFSDVADLTGTAAATGYTGASAINIAAGRTVWGSLVVSALNNKLNFTDDDGTVTATIASGTYTDPWLLAQAVATAMNAANGALVASVNFSSVTGKFKIKSTGTVLSLLWKTGTNGSDNTDTHIGTLLGYSDAANDSGTAAGTGYVSDTAISSSTLSASYDSADPQAAKNNEVLIGDSTDVTCFCASTIDFTISNELQDVQCICAESGVQETIINKRSIDIKIVGILTAYDVAKFKKYRSNADARMCFNYGSKSGGNWVAGTVGCIYVPVAKISSHTLGDNNGLATMEISVRPYVDSSGNGEFYVNFL